MIVDVEGVICISETTQIALIVDTVATEVMVEVDVVVMEEVVAADAAVVVGVADSICIHFGSCPINQKRDESV